MFKLKLDSKAEKFVKKCDRILLDRINKKLESLKFTPFPFDCKRVENREDKMFRIRIGDYRIIYSVTEDTIFIINIDKRSNAYKINEEEGAYNLLESS